MESWEIWGSFLVTSDLTGLMKSSPACTSVILIFEGILQEMLIWKVIETVYWLISIYFFSLSDRKGHLHLQLHWLAEDTCEKRKLPSLLWLRPPRAWAVCRAWWLGWKMHQVSNLQLFLSEYVAFSCSHWHRKASFGRFFNSGQNIWSLLFLVEGSSVFQMISSGEEWLNTHPPIWLVTTIVLNGASAFAAVDLSVCLKAKCFFCLFTF